MYMKHARTAPPQDIHTVEELVHALREGPEKGSYLGILERMAIPAGLFVPYCTWNDKRYTRNCIVRTDDFELLLICYGPGQSTSIHDYSTEEAWVRPVMGSVVEERFTAGPGGSLLKTSVAKLDTGSFSYLHGGPNIHRFSNDSGEPAITLNLYARPLNKWRVYDERSGGSQWNTPDGRTA